MPSVLAKRTPASKHSLWDRVTASNRPSSYMCDNSGDMPWYRRPPAWIGSGTNECPSVCILSSGVSPAVSPKS